MRLQARSDKDIELGDWIGEGWIDDLICTRRSVLRGECRRYALSVIVNRGYLERGGLIELPDLRYLRVERIRKLGIGGYREVARAKAPALAITHVSGVGWDPQPEDYVPYVGRITVRFYSAQRPAGRRRLGSLGPMLRLLLGGIR